MNYRNRAALLLASLLGAFATSPAEGAADTSSARQEPQTKPSAPTGLSSATPQPGKRWTNGLGMAFAPVKGTKVLFGTWETRVRDFEAFVAGSGRDMGQGMVCFNSDLKPGTWEGYNWKNPGFAQGPDHPVVGVSWEDAQAFCDWFTEVERKGGRLVPGQEYRLPTDLEWSRAVGLENEAGNTPEERSGKVKSAFPWGAQWPPPQGAGNYADKAANRKYPDWPTLEGYDDGCTETAPVGSFSPNQYGLYDMGGNVWEWCSDWYNGEQKHRSARGAWWLDAHDACMLSSFRFARGPSVRGNDIGFRVVLVPDGPFR